MAPWGYRDTAVRARAVDDSRSNGDEISETRTRRLTLMACHCRRTVGD
jgi:hypothetical protein